MSMRMIDFLLPWHELKKTDPQLLLRLLHLKREWCSLQQAFSNTLGGIIG
eukprot:NODE_6275_length_518_cov_1.453564.p5 GENE.NODE_6275_length_518_cov_1.453564~~NODE_6275_length_518_cov_1.453564.p5  ORF type:complete len:50 (-),score=11.31 NODE_6275_length_518_cov_1.453564:37-186(-)